MARSIRLGVCFFLALLSSVALRADVPAITTQPASLTVTQGQAAVFLVVATGTEPLTYQWQLDGADVSKATNATLTLANAGPGQIGGYRAVVTNPEGVATSQVATLIVLLPPTITAQPQSQTVTNGADVMFSVTATGDAPLLHQWRFNGNDLTGATNSMFGLTTVGPANAGSYTVVISNAVGMVTSQVATLVVQVADLGVEQTPYYQLVAVGADLLYTIVVTNRGPAMAESVTLHDEIPAIVTFSSAIASQGGCGLTNGAVECALGSVPPNASVQIFLTVVPSSDGGLTNTVTVNSTTFDPAPGDNRSVLNGQAMTRPAITSQPASQAVTNGATVTFTANTSGTDPLSYQWRFNGSALANATNATLILAAVGPGSAGGYELFVTNLVGSVTSQVATLTLLLPPSISSQPQSRTVASGSDATFAVGAGGTSPLHYQWQRNGTELSDATNAALVLSAVTAANDGSYAVVVTNVLGTATSQLASLTVLLSPQIVTPPAKRSVLEGSSHEFSVVAQGAAPLQFQWRKNGTVLSGATNATLLLTAITTNHAGDYSVVVSNTVGVATSVLARLTVRRLTDPVYPSPQGGWVYRFAGDVASSSPSASLDGTWNRQNSLDSWAGDARGVGNGAIGGISISNGVMTIEDAQTGGSGFNNRRFYLTHDLAQDTVVTNANTLLDDGVTLTFRARLTPATDPWIELASAPNGWVNNSDGKGIFGLRQSGGSGLIIGFSLNTAIEDTGTASTFNFGQAGLHLNSLNGNVRSSFVDPGEGGTLSLLPLDPAVFHEFWVTIQNNGSTSGTHTVSIYLDGASTPTTFNITAGIGGPDGPSTNYLALGLGNATHQGAVDVDFFGYKAGVAIPAGFNQPPGFSPPPQSQIVAVGGQATFSVGLTGTPPFSLQWYRDGAALPGATNFTYTTPTVGTNDQLAAFTVVVTNECGAATSAPPALILLLAPPIITAQPSNRSVTNGDPVTLQVAVNSATTPVYQWRRNGTAVAGATAATLTFPSVSPAQAGSYDVTIENNSGSVTSTVAILTVQLEDWGDAPASFGTLKAANGARHLLAGGLFLGAAIDSETNGLPTLSANGDDASGNDDEDGVRFLSGPTAGLGASIEVVASGPGVLNAWLDLNQDGTWSQPGEQVLTNSVVAAGTNGLAFFIPVTAVLGNSYIRFRLAATGGLAFDGPAADGEVEDHLVVIGGSADLGIHSVQAPAAVSTNTLLEYTVTLTNAGPSSAANVIFTNTLPAGATFVAALPSQGSCSQAGAVVTCQLGLLTSFSQANVLVMLQPTAAGTLTNHVQIAGTQADPILGNNSAVFTTVVAEAPTIVTPPASRAVTNGASVSFVVVAAGTEPLRYQWRRDTAALPGATNATLNLSNVTPAAAGNYSVLVTNVAGSVVSGDAVLSVLSIPVVLVNPQSRTNLAGSTAVFQVQASGSAPLTYQWYFNGTTALAGQNAAQLSLAGVQLAQAGTYQVAISNVLGAVTSTPAALVVVAMDLGDALGASLPTLLADDGARHRLVPGVRLGALIDFEGDGQPDAGATGDDATGTDDEDGVILGATLTIGRTNSLSVIASTNGFLQAWIDYNRDGSWAGVGERVWTNAALVPGTNTLSFLLPGSAQAGDAAARFRFSTATNLSFLGEAPDGEVEDYRVTLVAEADLFASVSAPSLVAVGSNYIYRITVTNVGPAGASGVIMTNSLAGGVEFVSAVASQGACALAGGAVICQLGGVPASGSVQLTLTVVATSSGSLTNQTRLVSNTSDGNPGNNLTNTVVNAIERPEILVAPVNQTVTNGGLAQFSVTASGSELRYQWRHTSTNVPGATNATLSIPNAQPANAGAYTVLVSNLVGSAVSAPATLTVLVPLAITSQPVSQTVNKGATVSLNIGVTGSGPITYQWELNGADLPNGITAPLVLANIQASQGGSYRVRVSNPLGTVVSAEAVLTVIEPPFFTVHPQSSTNLVNSSITLTAQATGTPTITYQWYFNQTNALATRTNTTLPLTLLQPNQSGQYSLVASNAAGAVTSQVAVVTVLELDFGDAPETLGYPTTLAFDGARHRILPGVRLGSLIDRETDGQPNIGATGDNLSGSLDEDGIIITGLLLKGYSTPIQVIASTNGFIEAWIDLNANGTWVDAGEKVLSSQPVVAGANVVALPVPGTATPGSTYARFRFSTAGGLASVGFAPDGEVEDYAVTIQQAADLGVTMTDSPDPILVQGNLVYTILVTNNGPAAASSVSLSNTLPASVTFVSVSTSVGSCNHTAGLLRCTLGAFANGATALIQVTVRPNAAGTLSNAVTISTATLEGAVANNLASQVTRVFTPAFAFANGAAIPIADATASGPGRGSPYPSTITVSGLTGVVHKVTVNLLGLSHTYADDLDVLLVGPSGQTVFLMSDAGGNTALSSVNLTLDDDAELTLPNTGTITSTAYRPTLYEATSDFFPAPAPTAPYGTLLSALAGTNPNGVWSLYVVDDVDGDSGDMAGGWRLNISTADPIADLAAGLAPSAPVALGSNLVFTAFATNRGPAAASQVRLTNTVPANVSFVSATPSQGSCGVANGVVTCSLGAVAPGAVASVVLSYQPQSIGTVTNAVQVGADAVDFTPGNNGASGAGLVRPSTDVAMLQSTATNLFILGNDIVYAVTVTNRGPSAATAVAVSDPLPPGVTFVSASSTKGSCQHVSGQVDCAIGPLAGAEAATITLRVRPNAVGVYINIVTGSLAEIDLAFSNNRATNIVTVATVADLGVTLTGAPNPVAVDQPVTFIATVTNRGPSSADAVVLTNGLPAGVTFVSASASQGACVNVAGIVQCNLGTLSVGSNAFATLVLRASAPGPFLNTVGVGSLAMEVAPSDNNATATVAVEVPPGVVIPPASQTVTNGGQATFTVTGSGTAPLFYQWSHAGQALAGATNATFTLPSAGYTDRGAYAVTISNRVGTVLSAPAILTVRVPPSISDVPDLNLDEDTPSGERPLLVTDVDHFPEELVIEVESSNPTLLPITNVALTGTSSNRTVRVTPATNQTGTATVTLIVRDPSNLTARDSFVVTVAPVNDPPNIPGIANQQMDEDTVLSLPFDLTDVDSDATNVVVTVRSADENLLPSAGLLVTGEGSHRVLRAAPATNQYGTALVTLVASDSAGGTNELSFLLTVNPVNDAPTLAPLPNLLMLENGSPLVLPIAGITTGVTNEADLLVITATSSGPGIVPHPAVAYVSPAGTGAVTVVPAANQSGTVTVTVTVDDGGATNRLASRQFTVRVLPTAERPFIRSIVITPGGVEVTFPTLVGVIYTLEFTDDFSVTSWSSLGPITGTGGDVTVTDPSVVGPRFYRLRARIE